MGVKQSSAICAKAKGGISLQCSQGYGGRPTAKNLVRNHDAMILQEIRKLASLVNRVADDAFAQDRVDLHTTFASNSLNYVAKLTVMDIFERVVRLAPCREDPTFLCRRNRLWSEKTSLSKSEWTCECGDAPIADREPSSHVRETMDAVGNISDTPDDTKLGHQLHSVAHGLWKRKWVNNLTCPDL
jgi:hypothetical protein